MLKLKMLQILNERLLVQQNFFEAYPKHNLYFPRFIKSNWIGNVSPSCLYKKSSLKNLHIWCTAGVTITRSCDLTLLIPYVLFQSVKLFTYNATIVPTQCLLGSRSYGLLYETLTKSDFTLNCHMPYLTPLILRAFCSSNLSQLQMAPSIFTVICTSNSLIP